MMREPWFWRERSLAARTVAAGLAPLSLLYDLTQQARWRATKPAQTAVPIICIGNASLGGVGKTPFAIALAALLKAEGFAPNFLTRGYGGCIHGPTLVETGHSAEDVGDEALLLARHAPVWVARDRPVGAAKAAETGADIIIMDDGYQNPTIAKTVSVLLLDAADPQGNGKIFPAGPLREPIARARARADVTVYIGADEAAATHAADADETPFAAWLTPQDAPPPQCVVGFCGIGAPQRFFASLQSAGFDVVRQAAFPDHHFYTDQDAAALIKLSKAKNAALITTEKDYVRLPNAIAEQTLVFPVAMRINRPALLIAAVRTAIDRARKAE